jgi:hypothetical protein
MFNIIEQLNMCRTAVNEYEEHFNERKRRYKYEIRLVDERN